MKPLTTLLVLVTMTFASAQLRYKGEVEIAANPALLSTNASSTDRFGVSLRAHLEADYNLEPVTLRLVFDPAVSLGTPDSARLTYGLTELFVRYSLDNLDLSAGLERLALETARLTVPFRLEPVSTLGQPLGLVGARATLFTDDWRVRPALVYRSQDEQFGGGVSIRREFTAFDLELHVFYLDGVATGLGGSGLLGQMVIYGEAWLLSEPRAGRGAVGLSGFWRDLLWTIETAYAPNPVGGNAAYPQLLGQFSLPHGDSGSWDLSTGLALLDSSAGSSSMLAAFGNLAYSYLERDYQVSLGATFSHTEFATVYGARLSMTTFF